MKPFKIKTIADVRDLASLEAKIRSKITVSDKGCWVYGGTLNLSGYGSVSHEGRNYAVHRVMYEVTNGPIAQPTQKSDRWWVLHDCDNPSCCNPSHLYLGNAQDNANDCASRKRLRVGWRWGSDEREFDRVGTVYYEIGDEIASLKEWSERSGINISTLEQRITYGWPEEDLFRRPGGSFRSRRWSQKYRRFSGDAEVEEYPKSIRRSGSEPPPRRQISTPYQE